MIVLLFALPLGVLGAYLACLAWKGGHRGVALGLSVFSALSLGIGVVPLVVAWLFTQAAST